MTLPSPATFNPELSTDRLEAVSQWLLDELYATEDDLSRATDSGYTRGCTTFGRQKNRIIAEVRRVGMLGSACPTATTTSFSPSVGFLAVSATTIRPIHRKMRC